MQQEDQLSRDPDGYLSIRYRNPESQRLSKISVCWDKRENQSARVLAALQLAGQQRPSGGEPELDQRAHRRAFVW